MKSYNLLFNYIILIYTNQYTSSLNKNILKIYKYNKKPLQKLVYYIPRIISDLDYDFLKYNFYESNIIDTSEIYVPIIPINNESLKFTKKLITYKNIKYNTNLFELLKNKEFALEIITKYKYNILNLIPYHCDDNDIVIQSLKNNPEEIKFVSQRFKEEYIKCNFDINELLLRLDS